MLDMAGGREVMLEVVIEASSHWAPCQILNGAACDYDGPHFHHLLFESSDVQGTT